MPRLRQVARAQAAPEVLRYYDALFGDRDPVAAPGTSTGTPGNWWTVFALRPYVFAHATGHFGMFGMFSGESVSKLDPQIREIAIMRTGFVAESRFVFSQHCKAARKAGVDEKKIAAIPHWAVADVWTPFERAVLAYADCLILERGRVPDAVFEVCKSALSDEDLLELTYHICGYGSHAAMCRALRLEYDDVPERVTEIPASGGGDAGNRDGRAQSDRP